MVLIAAVSVAIERIIEFLWTGVDMTAGAFWPLSAMSKRMDELTNQLGESVQPLVVQGTAAAKFLQKNGAIRDDDATNLAKYLATANNQLTTLRKSATGSQRLTSYAAAASNVINSVNAQIAGVVKAATDTTSLDELIDLAALVVGAETTLKERQENKQGLAGKALDDWATQQGEKAAGDWKATLAGKSDAKRELAAMAVLNGTSFGHLRQASRVATSAVEGVADLLATFKSNPGRRLLSILFGVFAGVGIAGVFGLDVLAGAQNAALEQPTEDELTAITLGGILLTGLVMGLGSSPTHEVIAFLTKSKEKRQVDAAPDVEAIDVEGLGQRRNVGIGQETVRSSGKLGFEPPPVIRFR